MSTATQHAPIDGGKINRVSSDKLESSLVLSVAPGVLLELSGHSNKGSAQFIQLHDAKSVPVDGVKATGVLTLAANAVDGETVTIDGKVYTFQDTLTDVDGNVHIGVAATNTIDNLIAAITLGAGAGTDYATSTTLHPSVTASAGAGDTMDVTARGYGTIGNVATTETMTNGSWGAVTLTGGAGAPPALSKTVAANANFEFSFGKRGLPFTSGIVVTNSSVLDGKAIDAEDCLFSAVVAQS